MGCLKSYFKFEVKSKVSLHGIFFTAFEDLLGGLDETARNDFQLAASSYSSSSRGFTAEETGPAITRSGNSVF